MPRHMPHLDASTRFSFFESRCVISMCHVPCHLTRPCQPCHLLRIAVSSFVAHSSQLKLPLLISVDTLTHMAPSTWVISTPQLLLAVVVPHSSALLHLVASSSHRLHSTPLDSFATVLPICLVKRSCAWDVPCVMSRCVISTAIFHVSCSMPHQLTHKLQCHLS